MKKEHSIMLTKNFSRKEVLCDRLVDRNTLARLMRTLNKLQLIRDALGCPLKITSAWRPGDEGGPHKLGHAIDFQPSPHVEGWMPRVLEIVTEIGMEKDERLFFEATNNSANDGWCHIDTGHSTNGNLWIGYQKGAEMIYEHFKGTYPKELVEANR